MPVSRCFFCRRKIGKRKSGKLAYEDIYARDPEHGYLVCIDCFEALETSIRKARLRAHANLTKKGCEKCNYRGYSIINGEVIGCECRGDAREKDKESVGPLD